MKINRLSLLNSLFNVLNENNQGDPYFTLAAYFLQHYQELSTLNIYDVAAECFVSRSSIRRFCQSIGYDNFVSFKNEFVQYDDQSKNSLRHYNRENYRETLTSEINAMITELNERMNTIEVDHIADRIHNSRHIVFLTSNVGASAVIQFQQLMILQNKVVRLISDMYETTDFIRELTSEDYVIVISGTGVFAQAVSDYIQEVKAHKVLFTLNRSHEFDCVFNKIYHLSAIDRSKEGKSVYLTYGMQYTLDILYHAYVRKYGSHK